MKYLLVLVLFLAVPLAWGTSEECQEESNRAFSAAFMRDEGKSLEEVIKAFPSYMAGGVKWVYDNPGLEPWIIGRIVMESCLEK